MALYQLPSVTYSASGNDTVQLKDLPKQLRGRIPHVKRFIFEVDFDPTYSAGVGTTVGNNNVFTACDFWDGRINRFVGGFNHMRVKEMLSAGKIRIADSDYTVSASDRYYRRVLHVGPPHMAGGISDFMIPTGALENGELRVTMGALTDLDANVTAATGTVRVFADLELMDEVRIPPAYQFQRYAANSADVPLPGRALYESVTMLNSGTFDAITAGDFNAIRLDFGAGEVVNNIMAPALTAAYHDDFESGAVETFSGEPRHANDDNTKAVNRGTPTALEAAGVNIQPVYWAPKYGKLTKLELAETSARIQWSGTQTSATILVGRILPQNPAQIGAIASAALNAIKRNQKDIKIATVSKKPYQGPLVEFFPYKVKV